MNRTLYVALDQVLCTPRFIWSSTHLFKVRLTPKHNSFLSPCIQPLCSMVKICIVSFWAATAAQDEESKNSLEGTSLRKTHFIQQVEDIKIIYKLWNFVLKFPLDFILKVHDWRLVVTGVCTKDRHVSAGLTRSLVYLVPRVTRACTFRA